MADMVARTRGLKPDSERIRHQKAAAFCVLATALLGGRGWKQILSDALGYHYASICRYANGELDVPPILWAHLELMARTMRKRYWPEVKLGAEAPTGPGPASMEMIVQYVPPVEAKKLARNSAREK